jgi:hypothetical protein
MRRKRWNLTMSNDFFPLRQSGWRGLIPVVACDPVPHAAGSSFILKASAWRGKVLYGAVTVTTVQHAAHPQPSATPVCALLRAARRQPSEQRRTVESHAPAAALLHADPVRGRVERHSYTAMARASAQPGRRDSWSGLTVGGRIEGAARASPSHLFLGANAGSGDAADRTFYLAMASISVFPQFGPPVVVEPDTRASRAPCRALGEICKAFSPTKCAHCPRAQSVFSTRM